MLSPSPLPSIPLLFFSSIRSNDANNFGKSSFLTPTPVSSIATCNETFLAPFSAVILSVIDPSFVYLTALFIRLTRICLMRIASPYNFAGIFGDTSILSSSPLSAALSDTIVITSFKTSLRSYVSSTSSIFPDSTFDKSRISFIRARRLSPALLISLEYPRITSSLLSLSIKVFNPNTAFNGVLISCDILARNVLFASFAFRASSFASVSSSLDFLSSSISFKIL